MAEGVLEPWCEPDLIDQLGREPIRRRTGSTPSAVSRSDAKREPIDCRRVQRLFGTGSRRSMRARDGRLQRGGHSHLGDISARHV